MSTSKFKASMKRANRKLIIFSLIAVICISLTARLMPAALQLAVASHDITYHGNIVYEEENKIRQELYNSEDGLVRWFAHTMGQNTGLRALSVLLLLAQLAGAVIFPLLCIMVSINMVKEMARYQKYRATRRAAR